MLNDSKTSKPSEQPTLFDLPSLREGSRVRTFQQPGNVKVLRGGGAVYGQNTTDSFANYDPSSSSWKTSQLCMTGGLMSYSATWPRAGTMRNGTAYPRPPLVPHILENASGLLPTPVAYDATPGGPNNHYKGLGHYAKHQLGGKLNPRWVEWLMGYPDNWTELDASATPSSHKSQRKSHG